MCTKIVQVGWYTPACTILALKYRLANGLLVFEKTDLPRIFTGGQRTIKDSLAQLVKMCVQKNGLKKQHPDPPAIAAPTACFIRAMRETTSNLTAPMNKLLSRHATSSRDRRHLPRLFRFSNSRWLLRPFIRAAMERICIIKKSGLKP